MQQSFPKDAVSRFLKKHYQLQGELEGLPGYCDVNYLWSTPDGKYVVKIAHPDASLQELAMQNAAMAHLKMQGHPVPAVVHNLSGEGMMTLQDADGRACCLRVLTYLEGPFYADIASGGHGPVLWRHLGGFVGQLAVSFQDFEHPGIYRDLEWDLAQGYRVCRQKLHILDPEQQELVDHFLSCYRTQTLPLLGDLPQGVIHNDANDHNLLVDQVQHPSSITGLIDFGDMLHSHLVNDLAITCAYALMGQENPLEVMGHIVAGYHEQRALRESEMEVLYHLVALRLCTSVCNAAQAIQSQPDNTYISVSVKPAWRLLTQLRAVHAFSARCQVHRACGLPVDTGKTSSALLEYRQQHVCRSLSTSYQKPLKMVRGQGSYLYDASGQPYLDMVNNVCHVGHCHPRVVAAGQAQMSQLNTNTRYLHDHLVDYTDALLQTMPASLSVCVFVNSGSEANDLALRMARCFSRSRECLVVDGAYHGHTQACIEVSPYKFDGPGGEGVPDKVHTVTQPDPYRGPFTGMGPETARAYAARVEEVIAGLADGNRKPGAFICETLQGVAGQIILPEGYLQRVYEQVRRAGGVCIADEVQVGFGRVGTHMWAFETQGVVPDILTLGKPIGNGHPLAAVVTTREIADAFDNGMEYFNTFGGNPVSCAIGMAVLETIQKENLQQNALLTGNYLLRRLRELQQVSELIGDVRGLGLFIGVELVEDRQTKRPAAEKAAHLIEFLKDRHILLSTDGPFHNVLKIKPPMTFHQGDADQFLDALRRGLDALGSSGQA
ncbi:aminotransferase class III-fold pyridoxal phosphate-dependent enzyme [bacterium]|nr:aminotransferase class III-fold pyridoxal phosphate-dependent enzyme [bacterium]